MGVAESADTGDISIHALLAESDKERLIYGTRTAYFYPRSPCGERQYTSAGTFSTYVISIHALLAESDPMGYVRGVFLLRFLSTLSLRRATYGLCEGGVSFAYFYPRSPCGERRRSRKQRHPKMSFLSTLSLRRATETLRTVSVKKTFLSTLSLRRATGHVEVG